MFLLRFDPMTDLRITWARGAWQDKSMGGRSAAAGGGGEEPRFRLGDSRCVQGDLEGV